MKCPHCGFINLDCKVTDSRPYKGTIKRTRLCEHCKQKWRTFEIEENRYLYCASRDKTGRRFWTEKELESLVEFREKGITYEDIGKKFGRTKQAVKQQVLKLRENGEYFDILDELNLES